MFHTGQSFREMLHRFQKEMKASKVKEWRIFLNSVHFRLSVFFHRWTHTTGSICSRVKNYVPCKLTIRSRIKKQKQNKTQTRPFSNWWLLRWHANNCEYMVLCPPGLEQQPQTCSLLFHSGQTTLCMHEVQITVSRIKRGPFDSDPRVTKKLPKQNVFKQEKNPSLPEVGTKSVAKPAPELKCIWLECNTSHETTTCLSL